VICGVMPLVTWRSSRPSLSRSSRRTDQSSPSPPTRQVGRLKTFARARIEIERVVHELRRGQRITGPQLGLGAGAAMPRWSFSCVVRPCRRRKIDEPVVVHVAEIGAHRMYGMCGTTC